MTISPEAVQAALDAMRGYKPCRDEQQADHVVVVEGELMFPVFEGPAEECDKFRIGKALAAAFPIMLREGEDVRAETLDRLISEGAALENRVDELGKHYVPMAALLSNKAIIAAAKVMQCPSGHPHPCRKCLASAAVVVAAAIDSAKTPCPTP